MYKILLFLGILIFILFMSSKEGFETPSVTSITDSAKSSITTPSIGKYDYLAPIPVGNMWNPDIITKFVNRFNSGLGTGNDDKLVKPDDQQVKSFSVYALEEEAVYYINHGNFPVCLHVKDFFDANPDVYPPQKVGTLTITTKNISQFVPNRILYASFLAPKESQVNPPPESYEIYTGKKQPTGISSSSTLSPADIETLKTVSDVQSLKSICSKY